MVTRYTAFLDREILAEVEVVDTHIHSRERWRGIRAVQTGTLWADDVLVSYQAISGAGVYGADANDEAQVLGTGDTPTITGNVRFDMHRIFVTEVSEDTPYSIRVVWGTGTMADAITAKQFSELLLSSDVTNPQQAAGTPVDLIMPRLRSGIDKVWIQARNPTDNATIEFRVGIHEYTV